MDLADSYHQFGIRKEDQEKTAFTWGKFGQLMFTGVPFGLKMMTGHMQALMEQLTWTIGIQPFQDDIAVSSESTEDHKKDVLEVLKLTYEANLRVRLKKCHFFVKEARVLGSIVTSYWNSNGSSQDSRQLTIGNDPNDAKALQRFLGAANFHQ